MGTTLDLTKKLIAMFLAVVLVLIGLVPQIAYADEGHATFTKKYTFMESAGKDSVKVDEYLTDEGVKYQLVDLGTPELDSSWVRPTRDVSTTQTKTLSISETSSASSYFDSEIEWTEDGYAGKLIQSGINSTPIYQSNTAQVDRTTSLSGLPDNDVNRLPQSMTFSVRSDSAPGATMDKALSLSDVSYTIDAYDQYGLPSSYTAHMNYRGTESWLSIKAYTVNCTYSGTISLVDSQMAMLGTYEEVDEFPWWLIAAGTAAAAAAAAIIIGLWFKRSRALIFEMFGRDEKLVAKTLVRKQGEGWMVQIPRDVPLGDINRAFEIEMPQKTLDMNVQIYQDDVVLYNSVAHRRIALINPLSGSNSPESLLEN